MLDTVTALTDLPMDLSATWRDLEGRYEQGRYDGQGGLDSLRVIRGTVPVLLSAPHAVTHHRGGRTKWADMGTGGLAEALASAAGASALACDGRPTRDPNYDAGGAFKRQLAVMLPATAAVIDLHGMKDGHGVDVCLGRGVNHDLAEPLLRVLLVSLRANGLTVSVDAPFDATRPDTVTATAQAAGTPAIQVEMARHLRSPGSAALADALRTAIEIIGS